MKQHSNNNTKYPTSYRARAVEMYTTGSSFEEIKRELGVSPNFVYYWMNHHTMRYHHMRVRGLV